MCSMPLFAAGWATPQHVLGTTDVTPGKSSTKTLKLIFGTLFSSTTQFHVYLPGLTTHSAFFNAGLR